MLLRLWIQKNSKVSFIEGSQKIAKDLGFESKTDFEAWAGQNTSIWGNDHGFSMFSSRMAFESDDRDMGARNLQDIINHLTEVKDRLPI